MSPSMITTRITHPHHSWSYKLHALVVFILTFLSYSLFHANRKTFSNLKHTISEEWSPSFHNKTVHELKPDKTWNRHNFYESYDSAELFLGILDTTFLFSYAIGLYISGFIGDRLPLRYVLTFGMCASACVVFIFGVVTEWLQFYNTALYICVWIVNGLLQSLGWPNVVAVMGNWFGKSSRGLVLGIWSACASVGNIIGALLTSLVLDYGYDYAFMVTSVILFAGGVIIFFGLIESPRELGYPVADEVTFEVDITTSLDPELHSPGSSVNEDSATESMYSDRQQCSIGSIGRSIERPKAITFCQAVLLPGVILFENVHLRRKYFANIHVMNKRKYSLAYACLKLVNYSLFFWLPYYFTAAFNWEETVADDISIWYDVGGIIGGGIIGFLSDRIGKRAIVIIPTLACAIPALFVFSHTANDLIQNAVMLAVVGVFIGGVANLVSAAVSADLGRQGPVAGSEEALATVTGIVDGTGSVGAAAGQMIVPLMEKHFSWYSVFYVFIVSTFMTGICISSMFVREVRDVWKEGCCHLRFRFKPRYTTENPEEDRSLLSDDNHDPDYEYCDAEAREKLVD